MTNPEPKTPDTPPLSAVTTATSDAVALDDSSVSVRKALAAVALDDEVKSKADDEVDAEIAHVYHPPKDATFKGSCMCGKVTIELLFPPMMNYYCHCSDCRAYHSAPVVAEMLFSYRGDDLGQVLRVSDQTHLARYNFTPQTHRYRCSHCGVALFNHLASLNVVATFPSVLRNANFKASMHVNYKERVMDVNDVLPKWKDFPSEFGGSGEREDK